MEMTCHVCGKQILLGEAVYLDALNSWLLPEGPYCVECAKIIEKETAA